MEHRIYYGANPKFVLSVICVRYISDYKTLKLNSNDNMPSIISLVVPPEAKSVEGEG